MKFVWLQDYILARLCAGLTHAGRIARSRVVLAAIVAACGFAIAPDLSAAATPLGTYGASGGQTVTLSGDPSGWLTITNDYDNSFDTIWAPNGAHSANAIIFGWPSNIAIHIGTGGPDDINCDDNYKNLVFALEGDDTISGSANVDWIICGEGQDYVECGSENDVCYGEEGIDFIYGDDGDDELWGDSPFQDVDISTDDIHGGWGNDYIDGGQGPDYLYGDEGDDVIHGRQDDDWMWGGLHNDILWGDAGHDVIDAGYGDDHVFCGDGDDLAEGGEGDDFIYGDLGQDDLFGNGGIDHLYGESGHDFIDGGADGDFLYGGADDDYLLDLSKDVVDVLWGDDDFLQQGIDTLCCRTWDNPTQDIAFGFSGADTFWIDDFDANDCWLDINDDWKGNNDPMPALPNARGFR